MESAGPLGRMLLAGSVDLFDLLPADHQETCRTLVDVIAGPHKDAAESTAASLPAAPRCPL